MSLSITRLPAHHEIEKKKNLFSANVETESLWITMFLRTFSCHGRLKMTLFEESFYSTEARENTELSALSLKHSENLAFKIGS